MGFDGGEIDTTEIGARRHPSRSISIEVLPLGLGNSALNGFYDNRLRTAGSPKTSGDAKGQGANGNDYQGATPAALTNSSMPLQFHPLLPATTLARIIQHRTWPVRRYLGKHLSSGWIPNRNSWLHLCQIQLINGQTFRALPHKARPWRSRATTLACSGGRSAAL